jgi:hypothetical protein
VFKTQDKVLTALRECGPLSVRELQQRLGKGSRGPCTLHVLDYFCTVGGMSSELRSALYVLLWRGAVELVPMRGTLRLRISR